MIEPTERQRVLLALVVHEYARTAAPVGSRYLVEHYNLDMSSATVRNELAALTELGYLRQPHTSAGREPTEEGYRFFVGRLLQETHLPATMRRTITHQFYQMRNDVEQWMRLAASVLAHQSRAASLVTAPHPEKTRLKHLELISTRGRQVLMVLVTVGGEVRQSFMTLSEPVTQEQLSMAANQITHQFRDKDADGIRAARAGFINLEKDVIDWVIDDMERAESSVSGEVYLDGLTNVLAEPEFSGSEDARRALRVLEERPVLQDLLTRTVLATSTMGGVQVLIGGEGTWDDLRQSSLLLSRYGVPGMATGTLGVLGPMRMSYGKTISVMRFLSGLLSDLVAETLVEDEESINHGEQALGYEACVKGNTMPEGKHKQTKENEVPVKGPDSSEDELIAGFKTEETTNEAPVDEVTISMDEFEALKTQLEEAENKAKEYFDGWQRERADFSNYKRRVDREQAVLSQNIAGEVIKKYLLVLDDLDRAMKLRPSEGEVSAWANGIDLIYRKLQNIIDAEGIKRIPAENEEFNPMRHEAISIEDSPEHSSGQIIGVVQEGYTLGERVLRPARVRVAR